MFTYVVARDYGFAPNPFGGYCTLATCKPLIRRFAQVGDWVAGTGSAVRIKRGNLVYAMKVTETMSFNEYWHDPRFQQKKPDLASSKKLAFGDNIYLFTKGGWTQLNSHHSYSDGSPNERNICNDTQTDRVLISNEFAYWGGDGPQIPANLRNFNGVDICPVRGYKKNFPNGMEASFLQWFNSLNTKGYLGRPIEWVRTP